MVKPNTAPTITATQVLQLQQQQQAPRVERNAMDTQSVLLHSMTVQQLLGFKVAQLHHAAQLALPGLSAAPGKLTSGESLCVCMPTLPAAAECVPIDVTALSVPPSCFMLIRTEANSSARQWEAQPGGLPVDAHTAGGTAAGLAAGQMMQRGRV